MSSTRGRWPLAVTPCYFGWGQSPGQGAQLTCRFSKWAKDLQWEIFASESLW